MPGNGREKGGKFFLNFLKLLLFFLHMSDLDRKLCGNNFDNLFLCLWGNSTEDKENHCTRTNFLSGHLRIALKVS